MERNVSSAPPSGLAYRRGGSCAPMSATGLSVPQSLRGPFIPSSSYVTCPVACAAHAQRSSPCPYSHTSVAVSELPATMGFRFSMPVWIDTIDKGKRGNRRHFVDFFFQARRGRVGGVYRLAAIRFI